MRKGSTVRLKSDARDRYGVRPPTQEELDAWRASDDSKGMDSAGETKLPPRTVLVSLRPTDTMIVLRARARAPVGWGNPRPGMTKVVRYEGLHTVGLEFYVRRCDLEEFVEV